VRGEKSHSTLIYQCTNFSTFKSMQQNKLPQIPECKPPAAVQYQTDKGYIPGKPYRAPVRRRSAEIKIHVFDYSTSISKKRILMGQDTFPYLDNQTYFLDQYRWHPQNRCGNFCNHFGVHFLIIEDIMSVGQRPKMDEMEPVLYCLLNMLYFNEKPTRWKRNRSVLYWGRILCSFQEDSHRDVFDPIREKLRSQQPIRRRGADYLCYALIDMIVDHYYLVMEKSASG
jgi:magnesium transporter